MLHVFQGARDGVRRMSGPADESDVVQGNRLQPDDAAESIWTRHAGRGPAAGIKLGPSRQHTVSPRYTGLSSKVFRSCTL